MCLVLVIVGSSAWATDASARLAECNDELAECKETCTIDYGTSFKLRKRLTRCVTVCAKKHKTCRARTVELQQVGIEELELPQEESAPKPPEEPAKPATAAAPDEADDEAVPAERAAQAQPRQPEPAPQVEQRAAVKEEKAAASEQQKEPAQKQAAPKKVTRQALDEWDEGVIER